jgi:hypothetical protein
LIASLIKLRQKKAKTPVPDSKESDNMTKECPKIKKKSHIGSVARVLLWDVVVVEEERCEVVSAGINNATHTVLFWP